MVFVAVLYTDEIVYLSKIDENRCFCNFRIWVILNSEKFKFYLINISDGKKKVVYLRHQ